MGEKKFPRTPHEKGPVVSYIVGLLKTVFILPLSCTAAAAATITFLGSLKKITFLMSYLYMKESS